MQKSTIPSDIPIIRDKQYQIKIPQQIKSVGKILGGVYSQFGDTQCLILYNSKQLYFLQIINESVLKYSSYNLPNINNLVSVIKGYLVITTKDQKLWLFELKKMEKKKQDTIAQKNDQKIEEKSQKMLTVQSYLKQISYHSYFIRQVTPNMVQLFITTATNDRLQKIVYIYQFTIKQKVGGLGFTLDKNYKIVSQSRKHLYASKNFYDPSINAILKLKNFSDLNFSVKRIQQQYLYIFPIGKSEQFVCLNRNSELINPQAPNQRKKVKQQLKGYQLQNSIIHLNYIMLQNNQGRLGLFVVEQAFKIKFLGFQSKEYHWQICFNGKLIGIKVDNSSIRVTRQLNKKNTSPVFPIEQLKINQNNLEQQRKTQNQAKDSSSNQSNSFQQQKIIEQTKYNSNQERRQKQKQQQIIKPQTKTQQNDKAQIKNEQQVLPKQKSAFKPTKIISKKGVKQIKKQQEQIKNNQDQIKQKQIISSEPIKQKQVQNQNQQIKNTQNSQIKKNQQFQANFNKAQSGSDYKLNQQNIPNNIQNKNVEQKTSNQSKQQNDLNEKNDLNNQNNNESQNKSSIEQIKSKTPFTKKHNSAEAIAANPIIIPAASYEQIFGNKSISSIQQSSPPVFSKSKNNKDQQSATKKSPFQKKQQTLMVSKQSSDVISQQSPSKKQQTNQQQQKRVQQNKFAQELQKSSPQKFSQDKIQPTSNQIIQQSNITDQKCCVNFEQTKQSYDFFAQKITSLQNKSKQIINQFQSLQTQLVNQITESFKSSQRQILKVNQQKSIKLINSTLQLSINDYFGKKLTPKVNDYFKSIMNNTKQIYDSTLKYYVEKKKQSIISLQNHFQQQEHLVTEMKIVTGDMLACVQNTINQGEQSHAYLLKQWEKSIGLFNKKLDSTAQKIENHEKSSNQRQRIIDSLAEIKESLINQQAKNKKELQMKQLKEARQIKQSKQKKQEKKQKQKNKIITQAQKFKTKKHKKSKNQQILIQSGYFPAYHGYYHYNYPYPY